MYAWLWNTADCFSSRYCNSVSNKCCGVAESLRYHNRLVQPRLICVTINTINFVTIMISGLGGSMTVPHRRCSARTVCRATPMASSWHPRMKVLSEPCSLEQMRFSGLEVKPSVLYQRGSGGDVCCKAKWQKPWIHLWLCTNLCIIHVWNIHRFNIAGEWKEQVDHLTSGLPLC